MSRKTIYNDFLGGLSIYDKNSPLNKYREGVDIDPYYNDGFLGPGRALTQIAVEGGTPSIDQKIVDMAVDGANGYLMGNSDKIYHMTNVLSQSWDADFDGSSHVYYQITGIGVTGEETAIYSISGTKYLLYAYNTSTAGDVGVYDLTSTFNDDYLSTDVGTGAAALEDAPHPMEEWKSYLWIGNGQYVGRFDGPNNTWDATKLDLGADWEVTALFSTQNYIGVCAWLKNSEGSSYRTTSRVFMWDGTSPTWNYYIPCSDNKILSVLNHSGVVYFWTRPTNTTGVRLGYLSDKGVKGIRRITAISSGTENNPGSMSRNSRDSYGGRVFFAINGWLYSYGRENDTQPMALTLVGSSPNTPISDSAGIVKFPFAESAVVSMFDLGTTLSYLYDLGTVSTNASWKGAYKDFGQDIQVNYVKFYFEPLSSGDSITPTIDVDYGTSVTLKTLEGESVINYTNEGAVTSKKMVPPQGKQKCHAFRPAIGTWAGHVKVSKIIVDYSFINDA